jgi:prepilin-type N-terminal cleavage/methylation domain-containing protein
MRQRRGFTLIELLIAIAIIAVLASVVFIAVNPSSRYAKARDSKRWRDAQTIASAINALLTTREGFIPTKLNDMVKGRYYMLGTGTYTSGCPNISAQTCVTQTGVVNMYPSPDYTSLGCLNIAADIVNQLPKMPVDPSNGTWSSLKTGYYITKTGLNAFTVGACTPETASYISVTR